MLARLAARSGQQQLDQQHVGRPSSASEQFGQHGRLVLSASQKLEPGAHYAADSVQAFMQLAAN